MKKILLPLQLLLLFIFIALNTVVKSFMRAKITCAWLFRCVSMNFKLDLLEPQYGGVLVHYRNISIDHHTQYLSIVLLKFHFSRCAADKLGGRVFKHN